MFRTIAIGLVIASAFLAGCSKPMAEARIVKNIDYQTDDYAAQPNDVYYAIRNAFARNGYTVASENLAEGVITSTWQPTTSDSHYFPVFGRRDLGAINSYYQLEVQVAPDSGRTRVKVGTRVKSLVSNLTSTGIEEGKILAGVGDSLRKAEPTVTNLGISE
jgi:uncharacterized lipoprotein